MENKEKEIAKWIETNLCDENGYLVTACYSTAATIYTTDIVGPLLATIMNGSGKSSHFKDCASSAEHEFEVLIRKYREATQNEQTYWFYHQEHDFAVGKLKLVEQCDYAYADHRLEYFEKDPAEQGGPSYLGLISGNYKYLLLHSYVPRKSFKISVHGEESFVAQLLSKLKKEAT